MADLSPDTAPLEERIGYAFQDRTLLLKSLTHPSFGAIDPAAPNNQRLEYLGDAVLGFVIAEALFRDLPDEREGNLTRYRSILARARQLWVLAEEIGLRDYIRSSEPVQGLLERGGTSVLEDALEALIGAVYLDGGLEAARAVVERIYGDIHHRLAMELAHLNPKGQLQELLQTRPDPAVIEYRVAAEAGPDHRKEFTIEVWIDGLLQGCGTGPSKRIAEEAAARQALGQFKATDPAGEEAR